MALETGKFKPEKNDKNISKTILARSRVIKTLLEEVEKIMTDNEISFERMSMDCTRDELFEYIREKTKSHKLFKRNSDETLRQAWNQVTEFKLTEPTRNKSTLFDPKTSPLFY